MKSSDAGKLARLRVDKWLWAARFFKTRSLAAEAIARNRIRIDGQKIKASRTVQPGDTVQVEKIPYRFDITVLALNDQRRPAGEAQLLYKETDESIAGRQRLAERLRADRQAGQGVAGTGRPDKRQRRQIIRFQNQNDIDATQLPDTAGTTGADTEPPGEPDVDG
jgi:ribosome-associated heat shock protein Hsp15